MASELGPCHVLVQARVIYNSESVGLSVEFGGGLDPLCTVFSELTPFSVLKGPLLS